MAGRNSKLTCSRSSDQFLILLITLVATFLRYVLYVVDSRMDGNWPNKFTYLFYLELVSEIVKLVIYLVGASRLLAAVVVYEPLSLTLYPNQVFFMLIFSYYGMPLHIVRDLWVSIKNLQRRIASYFRYRKITANLNERFPNPTEEELQETDRTCIICREEMQSDACKKLPCSHIFHVDCLKMWVQRQQVSWSLSLRWFAALSFSRPALLLVACRRRAQRAARRSQLDRVLLWFQRRRSPRLLLLLPPRVRSQTHLQQQQQQQLRSTSVMVLACRVSLRVLPFRLLQLASRRLLLLLEPPQLTVLQRMQQRTHFTRMRQDTLHT